MTHRRPLPLVLTAMLGGLSGCGGEPAPPLAAITLDASRVAVAGVSSGAYMATQVHVALNARVHGAALVAGGPYGCAQGQLETALGPCMTAQPAPPAAATLVAVARQRAADGTIDPLATFTGDRVLVLHGKDDATVAPPLAPITAAVLRDLSGNAATVTLDDQRAFGHGWPTPDAGVPCGQPGSPWLLDCDIDAAGEVMGALFGEAGEAGAGTGALLRFDQRELAPEGAVGLADTGFVYRPGACTDAACGALVVFHGCQQNEESVGEAFVRDAGFNRWADVHRVVVVYPQAQSSYMPLNPKACWDWWGYGGADYDLRTGGQIRFVAALLDRLAGTR
ncbi:PHB depolymerase family esterase [Silanimonas algicola]